ncbi:hypothetical protein [Hyphococcus sp.]|uniref:hypothetical protein n=1 Tax=Hyphococcus sp. TaxID=2038636 RepID=UPI0035C6E5A7
MRGFSILFLCALSSGCTLGNINSLYRSPTLQDGSSHIVDAKQRFVLTYPGLVKTNSRGEVIRTQTISCAEPSPDVFSVYAASGDASLSKGDIGGSGSFATAETGASLLERTTALQALRDNYFRLCEGFAIGAIDEIDFMIGQRHNQTALIGLIAIEEMKAAARAPAVVIGGSASAASASGIREVASVIQKAIEENQTMAEQTAAATERIAEIDEALPEIVAAANKELGENPTDEETRKKKEAENQEEALTEERAKLEKENKKREAKTQTNDKVITALTKALETGGATGSAARSIIQQVSDSGPQCDSGCATQKAAIAKQMTEVVELIDDNDFGPTICLSYLRKQTPANIPTMAIMDEGADIPANSKKTTNHLESSTAGSWLSYAQKQVKMTDELTTQNYTTQSVMAVVCRDVMKEYVAGLKERRAVARILTQALVNSGDGVSPESIAAISQILDGGSGNVQIFQAPIIRTNGAAGNAEDGGVAVDLDMLLEGKAKLSVAEPEE